MYSIFHGQILSCLDSLIANLDMPYATFVFLSLTEPQVLVMSSHTHSRNAPWKLENGPSRLGSLLAESCGVQSSLHWTGFTFSVVCEANQNQPPVESRNHSIHLSPEISLSQPLLVPKFKSHVALHGMWHLLPQSCECMWQTIVKVICSE